MMTASRRVEAFLDLYQLLTDAKKLMVRAMVQLRTSDDGCVRRLLCERLSLSVPYVPVGVW